MVNFKERLNPQTSVKYSQTSVPSVIISDVALLKMFVYTSTVTDEVGWLGTVDVIGKNEYMITDTYMIGQQVHATTTEILPEGLSELGEELLAQPDGMEIWNKMQMWGHSHVNMGISPSGQDDKQMKEFESNGYPFFIRLICNKRGEMKLDFYNYETGMEYHDIPWQREVKEDAYQKRIDELLAEVAQARAEQEANAKAEEKVLVDAYTAPIKEEIREKVKKFSYVYTRPAGTVGNGSTTGYPYYGTGSGAGYGSGLQKTFIIDSDYASVDAINLTHTIWTYFSQKDIISMAQYMTTKQDLIEELFDMSMLSNYSKKDVELIWQEVTKQQWNMGVHY